MGREDHRLRPRVLTLSPRNQYAAKPVALPESALPWWCAPGPRKPARQQSGTLTVPTLKCCPGIPHMHSCEQCTPSRAPVMPVVWSSQPLSPKACLLNTNPVRHQLIKGGKGRGWELRGCQDQVLMCQLFLALVLCFTIPHISPYYGQRPALSIKSALDDDLLLLPLQ